MKKRLNNCVILLVNMFKFDKKYNNTNNYDYFCRQINKD